MALASRRQQDAYRPGTKKNRISSIKSLIGFAVDMKFDYKQPTPQQLCSYVERLIERKLTPNGIRSHISGIKSHFRDALLDTKSFESILLINAMRAVDISLPHKPKQKEPIHPDTLAKIINKIDTYENGRMVSFSVILMFTSLLRQSNLLAKTVKTFDKNRQLTCANVKLVADDLLSLDVKWSKTNQRYGESTTITAAKIPASILCPVARYVEIQPTESRDTDLPLVRFPDNNPITIKYVSTLWKKAIKDLNITTPNMTLHRLRLSGASWASSQGVSSLAICQQGSWVSDSYRAYIANPSDKPSQVNISMSGINDKIDG